MNKRRSKATTDDEFRKIAERAMLQGRRSAVKSDTSSAPVEGTGVSESETKADAAPAPEVPLPEPAKVKEALTAEENRVEPDEATAVPHTPTELEPARDGVVRITTGTRQGSRPPSISFRDETGPLPRTLNVVPGFMDLVTQWLREQRKVDRKAAASWLFRAALHDFPTDPDELLQLARLVPEECYRERPVRVGAAITEDIVAKLEDAQFEIMATRSRSTKVWHCVSAALARQLESEGVRLVLQDE